MNHSSVIAVLAAGVILSACTNLGNTSGVISATSGVDHPALHSSATGLPESIEISNSKKSRDFVYVAAQGALSYYNFPTLGKPVGSIAQYASGICSDKNGNVWTAARVSADDFVMTEYAHGGSTPIAALSLPSTTHPVGCSVSRKTGDLAVFSAPPTTNDKAVLLVYQKAKGEPRIFTDPNFRTFGGGGYDFDGNLLVAGAPTTGRYTVFAELLRGAHSLREVSINPSFEGAASTIEWDGKYWVIAHFGALFQVSIANGTGSIVNEIPLAGLSGADYDVYFFGIQGNDIAVAWCEESDYCDLYVYPYPQGTPRLYHRSISVTTAPTGLAISDGSGT